jgi:ABC-type sugar transport system ATPase subunit
MPPRLELQSITERFERIRRRGEVSVAVRPMETGSLPGASGTGKVTPTGFALLSTMKTCLAGGTHDHRGRWISKEHGQMLFLTKAHDDLDLAIPTGG